MEREWKIHMNKIALKAKKKNKKPKARQCRQVKSDEKR